MPLTIILRRPDLRPHRRRCRARSRSETAGSGEPSAVGSHISTEESSPPIHRGRGGKGKSHTPLVADDVRGDDGPREQLRPIRHGCEASRRALLLPQWTDRVCCGGSGPRPRGRAIAWSQGCRRSWRRRLSYASIEAAAPGRGSVPRGRGRARQPRRAPLFVPLSRRRARARVCHRETRGRRRRRNLRLGWRRRSPSCFAEAARPKGIGQTYTLSRPPADGGSCY